MYPQTTSPPDNLPKYSATRKIEFLKALKRLEFSGKVDLERYGWTSMDDVSQQRADCVCNRRNPFYPAMAAAFVGSASAPEAGH